jgi:hypothetical protein
LLLELLEARNLLDGGLANVLINNPALDTTAQDTQSETAITLGAGSNVIVAYNDSINMNAGDNYHGTAYSFSSDGGASFTESSLPVNPHHDASDPVLVRSAKTGTVFLSTLSVDNVSVNPNPPPPLQWNGFEQVNVFRSTNNGASFDNPVVNGTPGFDPNADIQDKPWIAVDNFPGPGYGNVYMVNFHLAPAAKKFYSYDIRLTRSTDDGLTWGPSGGTVLTSSVLPFFQGANVTVGPDHSVYVSWYNVKTVSVKSFMAKNPEILMCKSTDQGVTFSQPGGVVGLQTQGFPFGDLGLTDSSGHWFTTNAFPQAVVNPVTGDIYVVYDDVGSGSGDKADVYFTESTDGGNHWSRPLRVNDDATNNDQWFPALAVTPDGSHVGLFWYDRRLDPANNLIDRYGTIGTVCGHTVNFGANFRITDVSFPPVFTYWDPVVSDWHIQDPVVRPGYMGDYDQATADNNYFYTTWGDNRVADAAHANQPDVRFAKIPVGWAGTDSSLAAPALISAAAAVTDPSAMVSSEASWKGLAVDAYFMDLARASQATSAVANGDTGPLHTFGLAVLSLPEDTVADVPPRAQVSDMPAAALARRAAHALTDEWTTDVLTSADAWWDGEAAWRGS